jgi:hypothetical protein
MLNFELFPEFFKVNLLKRRNILKFFGKKANLNYKFAYLLQNRVMFLNFSSYTSLVILLSV